MGMKRICPSCSAKFFDLNKDPAICPKCGHIIKDKMENHAESKQYLPELSDKQIALAKQAKLKDKFDKEDEQAEKTLMKQAGAPAETLDEIEFEDDDLDNFGSTTGRKVFDYEEEDWESFNEDSGLVDDLDYDNPFGDDDEIRL